MWNIKSSLELYCSDGTCVNWGLNWWLTESIYEHLGRVFDQFPSPIPKFLWRNWPKTGQGRELNPRVISGCLNESCSYIIVGIGTFRTWKEVNPKGTPSKYLRNTWISPVEILIFRCLMLQLSAILIIIWCWQTIGKDCQWVRKEQRLWYGKIRSGGAKRDIQYLLKMSDVCSFGDTSRASENMRGDIRMPAEKRLFRLGRRFPGKNCRE